MKSGSKIQHRHAYCMWDKTDKKLKIQPQLGEAHTMALNPRAVEIGDLQCAECELRGPHLARFVAL